MRHPKICLLVTGIVALLSGLGSLALYVLTVFSGAFADIFTFADILYSNIFLTVISFIIPIGLGIYYIVMSTKPLTYILEKIYIFYILMFVAILSNLITWIFAFLNYFLIKNYYASSRGKIKTKNSKETFYQPTEAKDFNAKEAEQKSEKLASEIEVLKKQKDNGTISEEEFSNKKLEIVKKYLWE